MSKLRLYTFCNFYLSSIQQGIQTAHIVGELWNSWKTTDYENCERSKMIWDWSNNHKTIIVCNGGTCHEILEQYKQLLVLKHNYPMALFSEEPGAIDAIGSAVTGFGIIVPEEVYDATLYDPQNIKPLIKEWRHYPFGGNETFWDHNSPETEILNYMKSCSLAR